MILHTSRKPLTRYRKRFVIGYNNFHGGNEGILFAIFPDEKTAQDAVEALQGAPLFDRRIRALQFELPRRGLRNFDITSGWLAVSSPLPENIMRRPIKLTPPTDGNQSWLRFGGLLADL